MIARILPLLGAFLMWAAFKPIGQGVFIFPAMFCWLVLVAWPGQLPRRSYKLIYAGSALAWLALLHGIRLAYWPLTFGWLALALYVAVYIPVFVFLSRYLVIRWRWPLALAAPITWAGCELLRCYVMTGFGGCLLSHAMANHPIAIQLASHLGPQLLSGLYVFIAATAVDFARTNSYLRSKIWPTENGIDPFSLRLDVSSSAMANSPASATIEAAPAAYPIPSKLALGLQVVLVGLACIASVLLYSQGQKIEASAQPLFKAALIQENAETRFEYSPERAQSTRRYYDLTARAAMQHNDLDLVVWPESIYSLRFAFFDWDGKQLPAAYAAHVSDSRDVYNQAKSYQQANLEGLGHLQKIAGGAYLNLLASAQEDTSPSNLPALLVGATRHSVRQTGFKIFNSALFKGKDDGEVQSYDKRKLVMFGEYIPFAKDRPDIYEFLGMSVLSEGEKWQVFEVNGAKIAPSVCFEDMLPQAMQEQTASLIRDKTPPDALINLTNDGWFRGSSMLDHHLACAVFTAVENRRPMLVAANTGISSWITGNGVIKIQSEKLAGEIITAMPTADARWGTWQSVGDWPARCCAAIIALASLVMIWKSQVKSYYDRRRELATNEQ